jgi:hypothetical protein
VDPSDEPPAFQRSTSVGRSPLPAYAVIAGAMLLVGFGFLSSLADDGDDGPSPLPTTSAPVAAATTRPTPRPTPVPTPVPTLAPTTAPATAAELSPTGVLVADTGDPATGDLVADVDGTIWTTRAGGVVNVDPRTGRAREWTLADDPAFAAPSLAAARAGGVWLLGRDAIRHFDGMRFPVVIETPADMWGVVEDPGGSLWAQTEEYGLIRWADGVWASDPLGRPGRGAGGIVVDADGRVWTIDYERREGGDENLLGVSMWDGSAWTSYSPDELPGLPEDWDWGTALVASGDGSVWVRSGGRVARFRADRWTEYEVGGLAGAATWNASLRAVGDDGRLWFVQEGCLDEPCGVRIHAYDGSTLTTYDEEDGLPGAADVGWHGGTVLAGPGFVVASTEAGLYRSIDGSWQRLELSMPSAPLPPGSSPPGGVTALVALTRDEVWAAYQLDDRGTDGARSGGLFRFDGTAWHREQLPVEAPMGGMAIAPDGSLWVATTSGPVVRHEGTWIDLGDAVGRVAPASDDVDVDVDVECGGAVVADVGLAYYAGPRSANRLIELRLVEGTWEASLHPAPPLDGPCWSTLAVTADGTIWLLERGWGTYLSRSVGGGWWENAPSPPMVQPGSSEYAAIAADQDGSLWVITGTWEEADASRTGVWQVDEGRWIRRGGGEGIEYITKMAPLADGSLIAVGDGIAMFDGQRWHRSLDGMWIDNVSVAPDGAVWVAGPNVYRLPPSLP